MKKQSFYKLFAFAIAALFAVPTFAEGITTVTTENEANEVQVQAPQKEKKHKRFTDGDKYYGSQKGGFALSVSATPLINFVGNMFNGTTEQGFDGFKGLGTDLFDGATITGKYMVDDRWSLNLGLGFNNQSNTEYAYNDPDDLDKETMKIKKGTHRFLLNVGTQYLLRPGKRLQPILGIGLLYAYSNIDYQKRYSDVKGAEVDTKTKHPAHTLGLIGNVGVEFFFCKSVSVFGTVDLGICKTWNNFKYTNNEVDNVDQSHLTGADFELKTGQFGGNFGFNFYF